MEQKIEIPVSLANAILQFLGSQPYIEVHTMIDALQKAGQSLDDTKKE